MVSDWVPSRGCRSPHGRPAPRLRTHRPATSLAIHTAPKPVRRAAQPHSAAVAGWALPNEPTAVVTARRHIQAATYALDPEVGYLARSLTSEIVTTLLIRGRSNDMGLRYRATADSVRIEAAGYFPTRGTHLVPYQGFGPSGGMMIVGRLASAWGVTEGPSSQDGAVAIWFRIDL